MKLLITQIQDPSVRENFKRLQEYFEQTSALEGFIHVDLLIESAVTHLKHRHGLGYKPQDVLMTKITGPGILTWHHDLFDEQFLNLSTDGACRIRAFIGTYQNSEAAPDE